MFAVPELGGRLWHQAYQFAYTLGVPEWAAYAGWYLARLR